MNYIYQCSSHETGLKRISSFVRGSSYACLLVMLSFFVAQLFFFAFFCFFCFFSLSNYFGSFHASLYLGGMVGGGFKYNPSLQNDVFKENLLKNFGTSWYFHQIWISLFWPISTQKQFLLLPLTLWASSCLGFSIFFHNLVSLFLFQC